MGHRSVEGRLDTIEAELAKLSGWVGHFRAEEEAKEAAARSAKETVEETALLDQLVSGVEDA